MGLYRVLAYEKFLGDLAVAHALSDQLQDLKLASGDAEVLSFAVIWSERGECNRNLFKDDPLFISSQLQAKPNAENSKGRGNQSTVDFERMLDYEEAILGEFQQGYKESAD